MKGARWLMLAGGLVALGLWAAEPGTGQAQPANKGKGTIVKLGSLESRTPADWHEEKPDNRLRLKQFRLSPVMDDKDNVEVIIFYFGEGQGGSAEENIKRWKSMFVPPEGKKIDEVAKVEKLKVGSVPVTMLDIRGTYSFRSPPFDPNAKTSLRPNYRMLGVVFEAPKGPYFIRMVGPADSVTFYQKGFEEWIKGFK